MRIAVLNITSGGMSGGFRKYLYKLIPRLVSHSAISDLLVGIPLSFDIRQWVDEFPTVHWVLLKNPFWRRRSISYLLHKKIENFNPDILFIPTARLYKIKGVPVINMVRNMEPMVRINENPFMEKIINWARAKKAYKSVFHANRIIAVSNYVREFMINEWGINPKNISVVYHGVEYLNSNNFRKPLIIPPSWKDGFLFTAGSVRPARGLEDILYAFKDVVKKYVNIPGLVIAGETIPIMKKYRKKIEGWLEDNNLSDRVYWTGKLNEEEMSWCYKNCSVFVMTSRVEACPNIVLEAMANGCICVSTNVPPMPEFFKDLAFYYTPGDGKALSQAIRQALGIDNDKRCELSERAKKRAAEFSWDICAEKTVAELKKAVQDFRLRSGYRGQS